MGIFSSKIELIQMIKSQEDKIKRLEDEKSAQVSEIVNLKEQITKLSEENRLYENKYIRTELECDSCYTVLQTEFRYCPRCGKKIEKNVEKSGIQNGSMFQTENDGNACLIVGYTGFKDKKIVIPSNINGRKVIGIWNKVFEQCEYIEEVIFEEGCQYIGNSAFAQCNNLKKVKLPKSLLEIGNTAFCQNRAISEIIIPIHVKKIGVGAFSDCTSLTKVVLPDGLEVISQSLFSGSAIRELDIPETVLVIQSYAFASTNLSEVVLPKQLRVIAYNAFDSCFALKKIVMHSNIEIMEKNIFERSNPVIYCAGGSKAQLYARKYNLECEEIQPIEYKDNRRLGVQFIQLSTDTRIQVNGRWTNVHYSVEQWIRLIGESKAAGYAYEKDRFNIKNMLSMRKYYTHEEAIKIQRELQAKGIVVQLFGYWGKSEV